MPKRIYLIRHGKASFGESSYDKLSETGKEQAMLIRKIEEIGKPDKIYCGELVRQYDTAKIAFDKSEIIQNKAWHEINYEDILGRFDPDFNDFKQGIAKIYKQKDPIAYFNAVYNKAVTRWIDSSDDATYMESFLNFKKRVSESLEIITRTNEEDTTIVTSAGVISMAVLLTTDGSPSRFLHLMSVILNASVTCIEVRPSGQTLFYFNHYQHLPAHLQTFR